MGGGISQQRSIPRFAPRTFRRSFVPRASAGAPPVLLWPDTFTDHFAPQIAHAAVRLLEAAGFSVTLPPAGLCCGRPLYDFGLLDRARSYLERIVSALREDIRAGVPVIGLEPSCTAVFRDELKQMFPHDEDAARLAGQTYLLGEFLVERAPHGRPARLDRRALVQVHCHQHADMDPGADRELLECAGVACERVGEGCCGAVASRSSRKRAGMHCISPAGTHPRCARQRRAHALSGRWNARAPRRLHADVDEEAFLIRVRLAGPILTNLVLATGSVRAPPSQRSGPTTGKNTAP